MYFSRDESGNMQAARPVSRVDNAPIALRVAGHETQCTLSVRSIRQLLDLIDNKLSSLIAIDREDHMTRSALSSAKRELLDALFVRRACQTPAREARPG